jgi:hypothetical protein
VLQVAADRSIAFAALTHAYLVSDFSVLNVAGEFPFRQAADLQDFRRLGKP